MAPFLLAGRRHCCASCRQSGCHGEPSLRCLKISSAACVAIWFDTCPMAMLAGGFFLDFTPRDAAAQSIFEEGSGGLYTDGTRACMEASESHLAYGVPISGGEAGEVGLRLVMDNQDVYCGHSAEVAVGHLAGWKYLTYGDFEWRARIHHSPDGSAPPPNSFTCFSTYVHGGKTHNEIAWCFPPTSGHEVHMSYWYDDRMHQTVRKVSVDLTQAIHKYTVRWREVGIDFLIDDVILHKVRGTAGVDVPWEPMSMRIILRPKNIPSMYLGTSVVEVAHVAYDPAYSVASDSVSYSSPTAATPSWATSSGTDTGDADAATPTSSHLQRSSPLPPPPHSPSPPPPRLRTTPSSCGCPQRHRRPLHCQHPLHRRRRHPYSRPLRPWYQRPLTTCCRRRRRRRLLLIFGRRTCLQLPWAASAAPPSAAP